MTLGAGRLRTLPPFLMMEVALMKTVLRSLLGCALFLLSAPALAQSSVLVGTVAHVDTKKPVEGVRVTATSPSFRGEQTTVTDEEGGYRIPQLPAGGYTLRFEKEGFKEFSQSDIHLRLNRTLRVNVAVVSSPSEHTLVFTRPPRSVAVGWEPQVGCGMGLPVETIPALVESGSRASPAPFWALPHMIVLVPDGTPQTVYEAPDFHLRSRVWR